MKDQLQVCKFYSKLSYQIILIGIKSSLNFSYYFGHAVTPTFKYLFLSYPEMCIPFITETLYLQTLIVNQQ